MRSHPKNWSQSEIVWRQFALMDLVMERVGADPLVAARKRGGSALADARKTCLACPVHRQCRDWLERGGDLARHAELCPNAGFFRECGQGDRSN